MNPIPLQYGTYYHIYNRGNNRENIFIEDRNYKYFMQLYAKYVEPVADTFAYCLMRNHFHFLTRIKDEKDLTGLLNPSKQFSNLFNAYARTINQTYQRTGALFQRPFGRIPVTSDAYFARLVVNIHQNPQKHGFVEDFRDWPYSSYQALMSTRPTRLKRDTVLDWFHGVKNVAEAHQQEMNDAEFAALTPEDFDT